MGACHTKRTTGDPLAGILVALLSGGVLVAQSGCGCFHRETSGLEVSPVTPCLDLEVTKTYTTCDRLLLGGRNSCSEILTLPAEYREHSDSPLEVEAGMEISYVVEQSRGKSSGEDEWEMSIPAQLGSKEISISFVIHDTGGL